MAFSLFIQASKSPACADPQIQYFPVMIWKTIWMTVSVLNGILDRLQLVHYFYLIIFCKPVPPSFSLSLSDITSFLVSGLKTLRLSSVVPSPLTLTLNQELGTPLWCHTCPLLFLNHAHRVASRAKILPSEIFNSSHTMHSAHNIVGAQ